MKCTCEMCGAYTTSAYEILRALKTNICPNCLTIGSLYIEEEGDE